MAFAAHTEEVRAALTAGRCVVHAPPGSGKTTLTPPLVANHLQGSTAPRVLVTAPRRIAVRAAAARLGDLAEREALVGYTIRGDRRVGPRNVVEFLTPGVLLRRLLADPGLEGVGAVILDEVHERSLEGDLLLGLLTDLRELREDLLLVAMSATAETDRLSALMGGAPVVASEGRNHPVDITYAPFGAPRLTERGVARAYLDHVVDVAVAAAREAPEADTLVFLPGRYEITYAVEKLSRALPDVEVLPLYSGVPAALQRRILSRGDTSGSRLIVSTNVAESALTVPGVRTVVDACLTREPRRDARRGMTGLVTTAASQAECVQRAGRAGRLGPGRAYRCVDEAEFAAARPTPAPEIATAPLTAAALILACWGAPGGRGLALLDPLPPEALDRALADLRDLGAIDDDGRPTRLGRQLATLPLEPALGSALITAAGEVGAGAAADVVAALALQGPAPGADLRALLRAVRTGQHPEAGEWRRERGRLARLVRDRAGTAGEAAASIGKIAARGPGLLARRVGETYLLETGTRAGLPPGSDLASEEWIVVTDVTRSRARAAATSGALIHAAAPIAPGDIPHVRTAVTHRRVDLHRGQVRAREESRYGHITISSTPVAPTGAEITSCVSAAVRREGVAILPWDEGAQRLRGRLALLFAHLGAPWPDVSEEALAADVGWLEPFITDRDLAKVPVAEALAALAGARRGELDRLTPPRVRVPSGRQVALSYSPAHPGEVRASVKLQECFGLHDSPTVLGGRLPVTFELLSPAGRPLAITRDLRFFWEEVYPQVRAENRGRYPKHPWPLDPGAHEATSATNRQLQRRA